MTRFSIMRPATVDRDVRRFKFFFRFLAVGRSQIAREVFRDGNHLGRHCRLFQR
jgi:hypothetical protein